MEAPLRNLADLARDAGATQLASEALGFAERLAEGRFFVACVGQFKRGKSTLLNALVGEPILPAGVLPITAVVTVLRWGESPRARVRTISSGWLDIEPGELATFVTEGENPSNRKGVSGAEVFIPSDLLATGMCLVDTPGLGSVLDEAGEATRDFIPHIDAAIVVVGGDPPISGAEVALVEEIAELVDDVIVVLNKADRLSGTERREAKAFAERILSERLGRPIGPAFEVSAAEQLADARDQRDWVRLRSKLATLAQDGASHLVAAAEQRALHLISERLLHELGEQQGALVRPIEESERRIDELKRFAAEAERSMADLGYLLTSAQERLSKSFAEHREMFLAYAGPEARCELGERLRSAVGNRGPALRSRAFTLAQEICRSWIDRWRVEEQPIAERMYREASQRFVDLANEFLERLAASAGPALSDFPRALDAEVGFRSRSRFYPTEMVEFTRRPPLAWLWELLRPHSFALRSAERAAAAYLRQLLMFNAARVTNALEEQLVESRRQLEAQIRTRLEETYASAERAFHIARSRRIAGEAASVGMAAKARVKAVPPRPGGENEDRSYGPPNPRLPVHPRRISGRRPTQP